MGDHMRAGIPDLDRYRDKRDFRKTPEPSGAGDGTAGGSIFVVQKHDASRLHYDLRLEMDGVLKSWAVPKGPSLNPEEKRLAIHVEDHPLSYSTFEGLIPEGQYGAGPVIVWDRGTWSGPDDPAQAIKKGKLSFTLKGQKLKGDWTLVRMQGEDRDNWLLIKADDEYARSPQAPEITQLEPESVTSSRTVEAVKRAANPEHNTDSRGQSRPNRQAWRERAAELQGARAVDRIPDLEPQLAKIADGAPDGPDWLHEVKFDGYRLLAHIDDGGVRLLTRNQNDWSDRFSSVQFELAGIPIQNSILDGEIVAVRDDGRSDFQALQNLARERDDAGLIYYLFDVPFLSGFDLRSVPLLARKEALRELLEAHTNSRLRYSRHSVGNGLAAFGNACRMGLEGLISKRVDGAYRSGRGGSWLKSKCYQRQEFVVGGYTDPQGERQRFGALLVGYYEDSEFVYAGRVGTGFDAGDLRDLSARLDQLEQNNRPFKSPLTRAQLEGVHWVKPELVVEVQFAGWTRDELVRQGSFKGLREDKPAREVTRETNGNGSGLLARMIDQLQSDQNSEDKTMTEEQRTEISGVRLTHPGRILFPEQGITKRQLATYYEQVADLILPHIIERPLALLRCPQGHQKQCFFQKNYTESIVGPIDRVPLEEESGEQATYMAVSNLAGLIQLAQLGTLELHPWGCRVDRLDRPDRLIFDLDPGPRVEWPAVVSAAYEVRDRLREFGLVSFVKTSGGKGLHVLAPLERRAGWDQVKSFAKGVANGMASRDPNHFVATASKKKRDGKIFVDYLRNSRGATNVAVYSTRARLGAPISTPIAWDDLEDVQAANEFNIDNIDQYLGSLVSDPWEGYFEVRQSVTKEMLAEVES